MKRIKFLVASVLFCAMGYVGYNAYEKMTTSEAAEFMKANIEALTLNEPGGGGGGYDVPDGYAYTSKCNVRLGFWSHCKVMVITCQGGGSGCNAKTCPVHPTK